MYRNELSRHPEAHGDFTLHEIRRSTYIPAVFPDRNETKGNRPLVSAVPEGFMSTEATSVSLKMQRRTLALVQHSLCTQGLNYGLHPRQS